MDCNVYCLFHKCWCYDNFSFPQIGSGRFSTVHMGNWHGDVAIKFLDMENLEDETTLEAFRLDVATFR